MGIHRPVDAEDFTAEDRKRLELMLPHLSRAAEMHMLLGSVALQTRLASELFGALAVAAIIVDSSGGVVYANQVAERLLASGDGLRLSQSRLGTLDPKEEASLRQAIVFASRVVGGEAATASNVLRVRRIGKQPLSVLVIPLWKDRWMDCPSGGLAVVFANEPKSRQLPAISALAALYRLTPAEARLMEALVEGERIADYAAKVGISTNTANTQLKQIFAKTETNRQADLIRQVLSDSIMCLAGRTSPRRETR